MLHGTPSVKEALRFKNILNRFSKALGMELNLTKYSIFFFNMHLAVQKNLSIVLGFKRCNLPSRYLGILLTDRPWQTLHWERILANLEKRCHHWTHRNLNSAGRLVLTKSVLQAIPRYMLSILLDPKGVLQKIRVIQRSFLWSGNSGKQKWSLMAWDKIYKPKHLGGLKLQYLFTVNQACGANLWCRWLKEPNLPWAKHWKENDTELSEGESNSIRALKTELAKRKIRKAQDNDQLRWGKHEGGNFTLKEARTYLEGTKHEEKFNWHSKVWDAQLWPKIKTFL
eukprot:PITA_29624